VARHDYEYERNGTANLFMMFAPLEGWRQVKVTDRHTALDYAQLLRELSDTHFPQAKKIVLVQDNLNTHKPASLYQAFPAAEARRLVERFEWHYTPKHGSWLDMAESELGVLSSECLDRRIPDKQTLMAEIGAWQDRRNTHHTRADWHFTTTDARIKLKGYTQQYERLRPLGHLADACIIGHQAEFTMRRRRPSFSRNSTKAERQLKVIAQTNGFTSCVGLHLRYMADRLLFSLFDPTQIAPTDPAKRATILH